MSEFENKVVIITGASSGIGADAANEFAKLGASMALTGRNTANLNAVAEKCKISGASDILCIKADFENMFEVKKVVDETIKKFGRIDCLINNAGLSKYGHLSEVKLKDFDLHMNVNLKSVLYLTQLAMPYLVESKGTVVNVSSICGMYQHPHLLVYSLAKAALDQFTKTVALDYASKGVRVNSINPSMVRTNIGRNTKMTEVQLDHYYTKGASSHPLGRIGTVEDTSSAIVFLASSISSWITGQCLVMDGGRGLHTS